MQYKNIFSFNVEWNYRTISMFTVLLILPNLLGMINIGTVYGFKLHFFQFAVFLAALIYGPWGGLMSGAVGSAYSALIMHNPYIVGGNIILGFFAGLFFRYNIKPVLAVLMAYIIQLPWLILTDYYLAELPWAFIWKLVVALLISNIIWAALAGYSFKPIKSYLRC